MADENNNPDLSSQTSPTTVDMGKKRARKLNNLPLFAVSVILGVILITIGLVILKRSQIAWAERAEEYGRSATELAKNVMWPAPGGIVEPKPEPQPEEPPAPEIPELPPPPPPKPELPKVNEHAKRIRELRYRQMEAALDSPIKVRIDALNTGTRTLQDSVASLETELASLERQARHAATGTATAPSSVTGNWRNSASVETPSTRFIIRAGAIIPATLETEIHSQIKGPITALVSHDVYDTPTGRHVLIPQGSQLFGDNPSDVAFGDRRLFVTWRRVKFPDGKVLNLDDMPGASGSGQMGLSDKVNNHYFRIFGSALLMSGVVAAVEMSQNRQNNARGSNQQRMGDALSEALGQNLGNVMVEMIRRNMSIAPTLEIRTGFRLNVMVTKDLLFTGPYGHFDYMAR